MSADPPLESAHCTLSLIGFIASGDACICLVSPTSDKLEAKCDMRQDLHLSCQMYNTMYMRDLSADWLVLAAEPASRVRVAGIAWCAVAVLWCVWSRPYMQA